MTVRTADTATIESRDEMRARIRAEAAVEMDGWYAWLDEMDAAHLNGVPKARKHRRASGASDWVRGDGGEHDALATLHPLELARLRDNDWLRHTGRNDADDVLDRLVDRGYADPWEEWLRVTRIIDACRAVKLGRVPGEWARHCGAFKWWTAVAPVCEADGIDVLAVMTAADDADVTNARDVDHATGTPTPIMVCVELVAYLDRLVYPPKREYAAALAAHLTTGTPAPARPKADWVHKVDAKVGRYCKGLVTAS